MTFSISQVIVFVLAMFMNDSSVTQQAKIDALQTIQAAIVQDIGNLSGVQVQPVVTTPLVVSPSVGSVSNFATAIPVGVPTASYAIGGQTCVVSRFIYGTTSPQAVYPITPSTGFNRAVVSGTVTNGSTLTTYKTSWTPYNIPYTNPAYNSELANIQASVDGLNNGDQLVYTVFLYNNGQEVNQFTGVLEYKSCQ